jgi:hypothetical protein
MTRLWILGLQHSELFSKLPEATTSSTRQIGGHAMRIGPWARRELMSLPSKAAGCVVAAELRLGDSGFTERSQALWFGVS